MVGRKDVEGNVTGWFKCSSPLGEGLGRAVAFLSLILGSLHPPSRPRGRGNLFSRVVWARPGQEGMGAGSGAPGFYHCETPPLPEDGQGGKRA